MDVFFVVWPGEEPDGPVPRLRGIVQLILYIGFC
jgi:hypothetical protein